MEHLIAQPRALSRRLYSSSHRIWICKVCASGRAGLQNSNRIQRRFKGYIAPAGGQARPIQGFYAELLSRPFKQTQTTTPSSPAPPAQPEPLLGVENEELLARAKQVFGSRIPRPEERRAELEAASQIIAGVRVPPRPTEPDNCCMSGCAHCVWDLYRDEMEDWAAKRAEARVAMQTRRESGRGTGTMVADEGTPLHVATSIDDDGGGSDTNWSVYVAQERLFDDIPVGIREFMMMEKKLKQRHSEER